MTSRQFDPAALARSKHLPVACAMPGTTLDLIPIEAFASGGLLYDTPGLHLHHRVPHLLTPEENKELHPRKRLSPFVAPSPEEVTAGCAGNGEPGWNAASLPNPATAYYNWGGIGRIDVLGCPTDTHLVFYGPPVLRVTALSFPPGEQQLSNAIDDILPTSNQHFFFGSASVAVRGGLRVAKKTSLPVPVRNRGVLCDIAFSGIPGWVAVYSSGKAGDQVALRIWAPVGVEVYIRPPLPMVQPLVI